MRAGVHEGELINVEDVVVLVMLVHLLAPDIYLVAVVPLEVGPVPVLVVFVLDASHDLCAVYPALSHGYLCGGGDVRGYVVHAFRRGLVVRAESGSVDGVARDVMTVAATEPHPKVLGTTAAEVGVVYAGDLDEVGGWLPVKVTSFVSSR